MRLLFSVLLFATISAHSQTTPEIYNYVTKGYITTLAQGLDFKKGYDSKELFKGSKFSGSLSSYTYQFSYRQFFKEGAPNNTLALMILLHKNGNVDKVFCLPAASSPNELWSQFFSDVNLLYSDQKQQLFQEIAVFFSYTLSAAEKSDK